MALRIRCCSLSSDEGPHFEFLQAAGFDVLPGNRTADLWNADELIEELQGCCGVVAGSEPYPENVLKALPELRVIARAGVGFDAVDVAACDRLGIVVATTPGVNHHAVAEHTIALLMAVQRGFPAQDQGVRKGEWLRLARPRIMGQNLGLVGLGRIGQAVATRAIGLGMNVLAFEPYPNQEFLDDWQVELCDLDSLLQRADFVSLHSPLTPETAHLINQTTLAKMKPGSVLINTARGGLVDENALCDALQSGHLGGAGMDVFENEPLDPSSPLLSFPNVLVSGHIAGLDVESQRDTLMMCAETIQALRDGRWPTECVRNRELTSEWKWDPEA